MNNWNRPDVTPDNPGEFRAALELEDASPEVLRWWNGSAWSNPYMANWSSALKEKVRNEISPFMPFWQVASDC